MSGRRMFVGAAMALLLTMGASGAAGAHWDDHPMGPGMMDPGMGPYPGCDWDDHGMGPYPGQDPGSYPSPYPRCDGDDNWWD